MVTLSSITERQQQAAEAQIRDKAKQVDYNTLEYPIEVIVQKYCDGLEDDTNEIYIPDYQREIAWDEAHQSKFIESILLGLPIPYIFVAEVSDEEEDYDARLEIIDGTQRIRTLARFLTNELQLSNLKKLNELNGFKFKNFPKPRQRRFQRNTLRMIRLRETADEEVRRDLFERINSGSMELNAMEKRRGSQPGLFLNLVEDLSKHPKFLELCSFPKAAIDRRDPQEYVLRFFAFLDNYQSFSGNVHDFLDDYLKSQNAALEQSENSTESLNKLRQTFLSVLSVIEELDPNSLRTGKHKIRPITRIKFESLSVGLALALQRRDNWIPRSLSFLESDEFQMYTKSDASSSKNKVVRRIEYVRDAVLAES